MARACATFNHTPSLVNHTHQYKNGQGRTGCCSSFNSPDIHLFHSNAFFFVCFNGDIQKMQQLWINHDSNSLRCSILIQGHSFWGCVCEIIRQSKESIILHSFYLSQTQWKRFNNTLAKPYLHPSAEITLARWLVSWQLKVCIVQCVSVIVRGQNHQWGCCIVQCIGVIVRGQNHQWGCLHSVMCQCNSEGLESSVGMLHSVVYQCNSEGLESSVGMLHSVVYWCNSEGLESSVGMLHSVVYWCNSEGLESSVGMLHSVVYWCNSEGLESSVGMLHSVVYWCNSEGLESSVGMLHSVVYWCNSEELESSVGMFAQCSVLV